MPVSAGISILIILAVALTTFATRVTPFLVFPKGKEIDVYKRHVEWRVDWFEHVFEFEKVEEVLKELREALGETPLLFTFRTSKEGGEKAIEAKEYAELNKKAAATGYVDLVDVEAFTGDEVVKEIIEAAHEVLSLIHIYRIILQYLKRYFFFICERMV